MPRSVLFLVILACRPDTAEPPAEPSADVPPGPAVVAAETRPASPPVAASSSLPSVKDAIDRDLDVMIGGHFSPAHLGPAAYEEMLARARASAEAYVRRLAARHSARVRVDPAYSDLHVVAALALLRTHAPEHVAMSARQFFDAFGVLLQQRGLDERQRARIRQQVELARVLAGGIDRPMPATPDPVRPDRVCVVATPEGHGLMPVVDCACGDVLACRAVRRGDAIELAVQRVPAPAMCDDCYSTWTTCMLDRLGAGEQVRLSLDGRKLGSLSANASGWLPAGACLP